MKTFLMAYAYDVPHYVDFKIEAPTEAEAIATAESALKKGAFDNVIGEPVLGNIDGNRVFCQYEAKDLGALAFGLNEMKDLDGFDANANTYRHDTTLTEATPQHVPGPWKLVAPGTDDNESPNYEIEDGYGRTATVYGELTSAETLATARLITAAPDLYAALNAILPYVPGYSENDTAGRPWIDAARAALRKATTGA